MFKKNMLLLPYKIWHQPKPLAAKLNPKLCRFLPLVNICKYNIFA